MSANYLDLARGLVATSPGAITGEWHVDGNYVRGPGKAAVIVVQSHGSATHLDFGFQIDDRRADLPIVWGCAAGFGASETASVERAVHIWATCPAPVVIELLSRTGRFADHYLADDPEGFAGWHAIHGPWLGWGTADGPQLLPQWALGRPLLPRLHHSTTRSSPSRTTSS